MKDSECKEFQLRNSLQWCLNRRASQVLNLNGVIQCANVICDFRCFVEKAFKLMSGRRRFHVFFKFTVSFAVIKYDAFKDMFPTYRKKCLTDK